jgi:cytochrome c oxidase assembly factor CtaG/putative copper export protein
MALVAMTGFVLMVGTLAFGGGAAAPLLVDPGVLVRYGLPTLSLSVRISSSVTIGALMLAAFALPPTHPAYERTMRIAAWSAGIWTVSSLAASVLTFSSVYLQPLRLDDRFGLLLASYFVETEFGRAWLWSTILAGLTSVGVIVARAQTPVFFAGVTAAAALWPLSELGHAAGSASHAQAVSSAFVHNVFVGMWVGGLISFALVFPSLRQSREILIPVMRRFSSIAMLSVVVVSVSGIANAAIRVGSFDALITTAYGQLVLVKTVLVALMIVAGARFRLTTIRRLETDRSPNAVAGLWRLLVGEVAVMAATVGLAVGLARTPTPVAELTPADLASPSPAEILTGRPLPPEFTVTRVFTLWDFDVIWTLIAFFGVLFYLHGVWRVVRRGDRWPLGRTISWILGLVTLWFTTNSGLALYGDYLFSAHMVAHMLLSMAIPILLVLGTPVTLAARAIQPRADGSRGAREWILLAVHSKYLALIGHPVVAAAIFAASLVVFYYSPLFRWALEDHLGHQWMTVHFLISGYLFALVLLDADPHPSRPAYPLRLVLVLATMAFHAFFGLGLIQGQGLLVPEWFGAMGRTWGLSPLADQQQGGEIAWGLGEFPTLALAILITYAWSRSDDRERTRSDRRADRDEDEELKAYNQMLQARAEADRRAGL